MAGELCDNCRACWEGESGVLLQCPSSQIGMSYCNDCRICDKERCALCCNQKNATTSTFIVPSDCPAQTYVCCPPPCPPRCTFQPASCFVDCSYFNTSVVIFVWLTIGTWFVTMAMMSFDDKALLSKTAPDVLMSGFRSFYQSVRQTVAIYNSNSKGDRFSMTCLAICGLNIAMVVARLSRCDLSCSKLLANNDNQPGNRRLYALPRCQQTLQSYEPAPRAMCCAAMIRDDQLDAANYTDQQEGHFSSSPIHHDFYQSNPGYAEQPTRQPQYGTISDNNEGLQKAPSATINADHMSNNMNTDGMSNNKHVDGGANQASTGGVSNQIEAGGVENHVNADGVSNQMNSDDISNNPQKSGFPSGIYDINGKPMLDKRKTRMFWPKRQKSKKEDSKEDLDQGTDPASRATTTREEETTAKCFSSRTDGACSKQIHVKNPAELAAKQATSKHDNKRSQSIASGTSADSVWQSLLRPGKINLLYRGLVDHKM